MVPGGGIEPPMSLRPKVFEFFVRLAPSVTIGHVWSIFSNLDASTSWLIWHMVPSGSSWCWHKIDTLDSTPLLVCRAPARPGDAGARCSPRPTRRIRNDSHRPFAPAGASYGSVDQPSQGPCALARCIEYPAT